MGLEDPKVSLKLRDLIERIALAVINKTRPASYTGEVMSFDAARRKALIRSAGSQLEDEWVEVAFTQHLQPAQAHTDLLTGNIVEVNGRPGNYWVTKIMSGNWTFTGNV